MYNDLLVPVSTSKSLYVWGSSNQITQYLRQLLQLSSLTSSALELQLLHLVLRNLITTTPNSEYMHIVAFLAQNLAS